jgi:T-complex protein 11
MIGTLLQVRDKLCSLTPNRDDMNRETREALDTERLQQMLNYNAFDAAAVSQTIRSVLRCIY